MHYEHYESMRSRGVWLGIAVGVAMIGCGGGADSAAENDTGSLTGADFTLGGSETEADDSSDAEDFPCYANAYGGEFEGRPARVGAGTISDASTMHTLEEITCQTRYKTDGTAFGWFASFESESFDELYVSITDGYTGDGTYGADSGLRASVREVLDVTLSDAAVLTLSGGGKNGSLEDAETGVTMDFACDPTDETAADSRAPLGEPAPGTAVIRRVRDGSTAYAEADEEILAPTIMCNKLAEDDSFQVLTWGSTKESVSVHATIDDDGSVRSAQVELRGYESWTPSGSEPASLECGDLISGSFEMGNTYENYFTVSFVCPIPD